VFAVVARVCSVKCRKLNPLLAFQINQRHAPAATQQPQKRSPDGSFPCQQQASQNSRSHSPAEPTTRAARRTWTHDLNRKAVGMGKAGGARGGNARGEDGAVFDDDGGNDGYEGGSKER
jgi:hypothetical protein